MSYYADLAATLRARGCTEPEVLDVLETAKETAAMSGGNPEDELGSAEDYAGRFEGTRGTTLRARIGRISTLAGAVLVVLGTVLVWRGPDLFPWGALLGAVVFVVVKGSRSRGVVTR